MANNPPELLQKAKAYAFWLLKFRLYSARELSKRLQNKKFNPKIVKEVLCFLREQGLLNDDYFAQAWIEARLKKPFALKRIRQELRLKGIDNQTIEEQINRIKENYSQENVVEKIAQERFVKLKNVEPQKAKKRIYDYLLRRGFSQEIVIEALDNL